MRGRERGRETVNVHIQEGMDVPTPSLWRQT